MEKYYTISII